ncbi:MAG: DUF4358 domain-containing protein [Clostridia bacterium]|nr:DUF4358 domain-containing protein [Clostridia bacterium]
MIQIRKATAAVLAFLLLAAFMLSACGGASYRTDLSAYQLADAVMQDPSTPSEDGFKTADTRFVSLYLGLTLEEGSYRIYLTNSSVQYDEIGFFKCADEKAAKDLAASIGVYLSAKKESDIPTAKGYAPGEVPKLENASCKVYGVYVIYTVLSVSDARAVEQAAEQALRQ